MDLQPVGPISLHEQISEHLRAFVEQADGTGRLPSEEQLVAQFGVSRTTVRRAIDTLVAEGAVVRRQGRGTFVTRAPVTQSLDRFGPFVDAFNEDDSVETRVVEFGWVPADAAAGTGLASDSDGELLRIWRVYVTDDVPHALVEIFLANRVGRLVTRAQVVAHPIYHVLQNELSIGMREAKVTVSCTPASPAVAEALNVDAAWPLLVLTRTTIADDGQAVEAAHHYLRPDVYQLSLTVRGRSLPKLIRLPSPDD